MYFMLREWKCDLHIHTALSPCANAEMSPREIVREAKKKGLDIIGIADHNSGENVSAVKRAGEKEGVKVVGGMEITSVEEVHILGFFDSDADLEALQNTVYGNLKGINDEALFGKQMLLDEKDNVLGHNYRLLIGSLELSLRTIVEIIHSRGGLAIASHVDRERFSLLGQLGFIPEGLSLDGLELSRFGSREEFQGKFPEVVSEYALAAFSDAHFLRDIGGAFTVFLMEKPSIPEMKKALRGEDGRSVSACAGYS